METTSNEFKKELGNIKDNVRQGANSIRQNVEQQIENSNWQERYEELRKRAGEAVEASEDFVKEHPYYTLLGAAAVGFLAGMILRRK
ncbi:hypothetical protein AZI86_12120 [Bdellovibrio bacteriovorus]|uniref:DUF883 domain-containing protein n=1 Tax=Bdellovibrio bacteriovorus TaxID=959 RepID=A0A150WMA9_BDEBC|nr:DUF883 family protein [Bdellovibrio bacteriovorus]KYG64937.1 hypothetical protein AZI86_12120 [Bdellovibrio bacteriovorus]